MIVLMVAGVAVDKSALGLPYSQWKDGRVLGNFDDIFGTGTLEHESSSFHWATQCLPVLTRNPVRCRQSVTCEVNQNSSYVTFYANSTGCSLILPITKSPNESIADERAGVACSGSRSPGKTTLLFGAVGNNSAQNLYDYMHMDYSANYTPFDNLENMDNTAEVRKARTERNNVTEFFRSHYPNGYGVTCDIDVEPSIGFRLATLTSVDAQAGGWDHSSRLSIQAGKSCEPILEKGGRIQDLQSYLRKDETLAAGAGAAASLLNGTEANLTTLMESINQNWSPGKTAFFDDSTSAFEDNLGVASALAIGMHWGSTYVDQTYNFTNGKLARARTRVGSKDAKAIFCILPSVFTAIILAFLAFDEYRRSGLEKNDVVGGQIMTPSL
jgi:hypothetical protein